MTLHSTYRTLLRIHLAWALQYRVMIALWAFAGVSAAFVSLAVWSAVAGSGALGTEWDGTRFAAYFLAVMLVDELTHTWTYWMWEWRVRQGTFAPLLLRPTHPLHMDVADNLAVKALSMSVKLPIAAAVGWAYGVRLALDATQVLALVASLVLAYALRTLIEATIACAAFWVTRMQAVASAWWLAWAFLSGQFAPISLLPHPVRVTAELLPLRWALEFPVRVALGEVHGAALALGLGAQVAWTLVFWWVFRAVYGTATRRFSAVGT